MPRKKNASGNCRSGIVDPPFGVSCGMWWGLEGPGMNVISPQLLFNVLVKLFDAF